MDTTIQYSLLAKNISYGPTTRFNSFYNDAGLQESGGSYSNKRQGDRL
jgi:hypothetical protein